MKTIAFFNNKGGVGKTSLVYHIAWMFKEMGVRVIAADLDPQANLTSMFLSEDHLEELWNSTEKTVYSAISPLTRGLGDISQAHIEEADTSIGLVAGDLSLSVIEDQFSNAWPASADGDERAFRIMSAFYRVIVRAGRDFDADVALIDVGPNLGAINRSALIASDHVIVPLGPDLFSLQGLRNVGPRLREWRKAWSERLGKAPADMRSELPEGRMQPEGYILMRHSVRLDRPVLSYQRWIERMPQAYHEKVLGERDVADIRIDDDDACLAQLKDYRSLMPMAQEARKPMFFLRPGDGAIGGHQTAVVSCYRDFRALAEKIADRCGLAT